MMINPIASALGFNTHATTVKSNAADNGSSDDSSPDAIANNTSDLFLKLLVAQLKTQDPTSPMDPTQMVGQMLSMNQLNELIQIRQLMQGVSTSSTSNQQTGA